MSHARQQIRDAVVTALTGNVSATVVPTRAWIVQTDELPVVLVYTNSEADSLDDPGASFEALSRILELVTEIVVTGPTTNADQLDDLAAEVETLLGANRELAGVLDMVPESSEVVETTEGEQVISRLVLTFATQYRTAVGSPETII
jgi:hypothetical protein